MSSRSRLAPGISLAVAALLVLSGCGLPLDASAKPLAPAQAGLLNGTAQIPGATPKPGATPFAVYFIRDGLLYPVRRYLYSSTLSVTAEATAALAALNAGPAAKELRKGITTSLYSQPRPRLRLDSVDEKPGRRVARVILDDEFVPPALFGTRLAEAYAQIVYTLTSSVFAQKIETVEFILNGTAWPAYLPNGSAGFAVGQDAYAIFAP